MNDSEIDDQLAARFDTIVVDPAVSSDEVAADVTARVRRRRHRRTGVRIGAAVLAVAALTVAVVARTEPSERVATRESTGPLHTTSAVYLVTIGYREGAQLADPSTGNASPLGPPRVPGKLSCNTCLIVRVGGRAFTAQDGRLYSFTPGDGQLRSVGTADAVFANAQGDGLIIVHGRGLQFANRDGSEVGNQVALPEGYSLTEQPKAVGDAIILRDDPAAFTHDLVAWNPATSAIDVLDHDVNHLIDARTNADGTTRLAWTSCPTKAFPCSLVLSDLDGSNERRVPPPVDGNGFYLGGAFSPDGRTLATTISMHPGTGNPDAGLAIIDTRTGAARIVPGSTFGVGEPYGYVAWSPDGTTVFFNGPHGVRAYTPATDHITDLPFAGSYYSVAVLPGLDRSRQCPGTEQPWQLGPPTPDETGDGLPSSGQATEAAARAASRSATDERPWAEPGRAWSHRPDGSIKIVPETIYTVVVKLKASDRCPSAPASSNGVPLTYIVGS